MSLLTNPAPENQVKPLGWGEMLIYCLGFGGGSFINLGFGTYLPYFWSDIMKLPLAAMATIILISRIIDGGTDIFIGFRVDKTKSKWGKARPWLLWMALPGFISVSALYFVPNFSEMGKIIWAFITYNGVAFFILTAMTLPLQSLMSMITDDPKKQLTMNMLGMSISTGFTVLGNMFVQKAIAAMGGGAAGYWRFFTLMAAAAMCLYLLTFWGTRERVVRDAKKAEKVTIPQVLKLFGANKWWILVTVFTVFSNFYPAFMGINMYYMTWVMKNPALMGPYMSTLFMALLIALIVGSPIVPRIGKINAAFIGMFLQLVGNLLPLADTSSVSLLMVSAALRGAGPALLLGTTLSFMCDVVDYGEWKTGTRLEGIVFAGSSMGGKLGLGLGGVIVTSLLAAGGYVGGATTQAPQTISMITMTFTWMYCIGSVACTVILFFLAKLDKQMPQIRADLEVRRKGAAS